MDIAVVNAFLEVIPLDTPDEEQLEIEREERRATGEDDDTPTYAVEGPNPHDPRGLRSKLRALADLRTQTLLGYPVLECIDAWDERDVWLSHFGHSIACWPESAGVAPREPAPCGQEGLQHVARFFNLRLVVAAPSGAPLFGTYEVNERARVMVTSTGRRAFDGMRKAAAFIGPSNVEEAWSATLARLS